MPLSQADRIAFSGAIVSAAAEIAGLASAQTQLLAVEAKDQALDTANSHLFSPINTLINEYQLELNAIDGNVRTTIAELDITNSAKKVIGNYFFPNQPTVTVPSLSALNNVWVQIQPFGLGVALGMNYNQTFTPGPSESAFISTAQGLIASASGNTDIVNTSGQSCIDGGTCSLPIYTNETDCLAHSGTWTPTEAIGPYPAVQTLATNLISAVNSIIAQANAEVAAINAIVDSDPTRTAQNAAALNYINSTLLPALNTWLAYPTFQTVPGSVTTCAAFNGYDPNLLAPTKLHSAQLSVLTSVLSARSTFLTTREGQLNANLGTVSQNITTGVYTGSGFYFKRLQYLDLRINAITGSLTALTGDQQAIAAQNQISSTLAANESIYMSIVPTTLLSASGNGTSVISLVDASLYSPGDTVYLISLSQPEVQRAIKSINGNSVLLNDVVPSKYSTLDQCRFYKDIS